MKKTLTIIAAIMALLPAATAQNVHYGESFELNSLLVPVQSHEYTASNYIDLNPGFLSIAVNTKSATLQLDPYGVFPPEEGLTGGPEASSDGVVGAIGGTVDVGLMGAAVYTIPIELPAGINGMQPSLAITYNSQSGNGLLGWGWDLAGLSRIERTGRTRYHDGTTGAVTLNDETDRFVLDGRRLVAVASYTDSVEYKTEQDEMSKIMAYYALLANGSSLDKGPIYTLSHFKIWKTDGYLYEYGSTTDSRFTLQNSGPKALSWLLSKISDRNGNAVIYHYNITPNTGEYYISSIEYTQHTENGSVTVNPEFTVLFHYRPANSQDYDFRYVAGNLAQSRKLLDYVSVSRNPTNTELERYSFEYGNCNPGFYYDDVQMHERLDKILLEKDGMALNPTKINWSSYSDGNVLNSVRIYDTAIYNNFPFVGDFNGDGYSDLAVVPHMDSVYNHNVDIGFFLNDANDPGNFTAAPALAMHDVDKRLDWLYPIDLNDDGLDDLVAAYYDSIAATGMETMYIKIFKNNGGNGFAYRDSISLGGHKLLVQTGDFLGNGSIQLLLMKKAGILPSAINSRLVYFDGNTLIKKSSLFNTSGLKDVAVGDFNGDGRTEVMVIKNNGSTVYSLNIANNLFTYTECFNENRINHNCGRWNHVFTGDFNGDGMTDVLFHRDSTSQFQPWFFFFSTGNGFYGRQQIHTLGIYKLPSGNLYSNSLRKVYDVMNLPSNWTGQYYSLCTADFDGDGSTDIALSMMTPTTSDICIFFKYNPDPDTFQSKFYGSTYNGQHQYETGYYYINCRSQYFHIGNFLGKDNMAFMGLEYSDGGSPGQNKRPAIFSLKPSSALNSVGSVVDGEGNPVDFEYGYVLEPYTNYGYGVRRIPAPLRVATSITMRNVSNKPMVTRLVFNEPCYHRDGHGWLGYRRTICKSIENSTETERVVSVQSLGIMTTHAMLLPVADTTFVFPGSAPVLASASSYLFEKVRNSYGSLDADHLVVCPALTEKSIVKFDPDHPNTVLSKTFIENHYNYANGFYNQVYRCDSTLTGVGNQNATSFANCEFKTKESTTYYGNDYASWTINRAHIQLLVKSRTGKPNVGRKWSYEYTATGSYLPSLVYEYPNTASHQDPLTLRTTCEYYSDGNLRKKTVKAPYAQYGEQQKTYEYEYGPNSQHRLLSSETLSNGALSYSTSYSYDDYDHVDTITAANGLATAYQSDAMGITSWTDNPDGTKSCTAMRWAQGHPLAPTGTSYYSWSRSSNGTQVLTFYHKTGTELRSVSFGMRGEPVITDRQYDNRGRLSALSDPYKDGETPRWTVYGYDNLNRLTSVTAPDGTCTSTVYDGYRTETTVTTPQGATQESAVTVNAMGWTVRSDDAGGSYVVYDHYADGLMATATVNGNASTTVTATYDCARRKATVADPDYGTMTTAYDAFGRLKRIESPRALAAQTATINYYDVLDRLTKTIDGMENTQTDYYYNETGVQKGTLHEMRFKHRGGADIQRIIYNYDALARPIMAIEQRAAGSYVTAMQYDSQSRLSRLVHPTGVAVRYGYSRGYLKDVTDDNGHLLWSTDDMDASCQMLKAQLGNGLVTQHTYDTVTHRLKSIVTSNNLQNLTYDYDNYGNLASRKDNIKNLKETFTYDDMNRLTGITLSRPSGQDLACAVTYDALGRMTSKQAVTAVNGVAQVSAVFSQPVFNATKVHAVSSAQSMSDMFPTGAQNVTYTSFEKARMIKLGLDTICYTYGYDQQRIGMEEYIGSSVRTKQYVGSCEYIAETGTSGTKTLTYLMGPYGVFAVVEKQNGVETLHYILKDNLGSWTTITNGNGAVEQRLSFDAWGNQRNPNTWANYTANDTYSKPMFDRGFTGHEHLTAFGLINMNGRMYDPVMSSFLSADRFVQNPMSAQGFNRYAYCMYNPLRFVDPSGWAPRPGGGHGPDDPPPYVTMYGYSGYQLEDVIVTASPIDNHEFEYIPNTSGGFESQWGDANNSQSNNYGSGGGGYGNLKGLIDAGIQRALSDCIIKYELTNLAIGANIASYAGSDFNKKMFWNYWYGQGDYELSSSEFEDMVSLAIQTKEPYLSEWNGDSALAVPVTFYGTTYANAIGTTTLFYDLNGNAIGIHEPYDFNLFPIRDSRSAQFKTTLVWSASLFNVHNKDFYINFNYHP